MVGFVCLVFWFQVSWVRVGYGLGSSNFGGFGNVIDGICRGCCAWMSVAGL